MKQLFITSKNKLTLISLLEKNLKGNMYLYNGKMDKVCGVLPIDNKFGLICICLENDILFLNEGEVVVFENDNCYINRNIESAVFLKMYYKKSVKLIDNLTDDNNKDITRKLQNMIGNTYVFFTASEERIYEYSEHGFDITVKNVFSHVYGIEISYIKDNNPNRTYYIIILTGSEIRLIGDKSIHITGVSGAIRIFDRI